MSKVVLLGSGNVAFHLADALNSSGISIIQIFGRNEITVKELSNTIGTNYTTKPENIISDADIYFFCMNDSANIEISGKITVKGNPVFVHTAGSQSMQIFDSKTKNYGVFYPFQTFTKGIDTNFSAIPICIEASNQYSNNILTEIAKKLNCKTYQLDSSNREELHLCGVFASNFMNHCVSISESILEEKNIDKDLIRPLLDQSFHKILTAGANNSQTGPALREDNKTIEKHIKLLSNKKQYSKVYKVLTESIIEWKKKN